MTNEEAGGSAPGADEHRDSPETVLDLRTPSGTGERGTKNRIQFDRAIDQHSTGWADIVSPFTWMFLGIIATAMFLPFVFIWSLSSPTVVLPGNASTPELVDAAARAIMDERMRAALDWAKTILPSAVGFGSAIVGYYFGTRSSSPSRSGDDSFASASRSAST